MQYLLLKEMENDSRYTEIPPEFYSFETRGLFTHCLECDRYLLEDDCDYIIERAIRNYPGFKATDVVFDYAICLDCAEAMHQKLSKESLEQMQLYFAENVDLQSRTHKVDSQNLDSLTAKCMVKGKAKADCEEFQIYAHCRGKKLFLQTPPYMICGQAIEELTERLSKETKDQLGGFFDKHFGPDPCLFEKGPKRRLLLV